MEKTYLWGACAIVAFLGFGYIVKANRLEGDLLNRCQRGVAVSGLPFDTGQQMCSCTVDEVVSRYPRIRHLPIVGEILTSNIDFESITLNARGVCAARIGVVYNN
jgi:hypothetical protein